MSKKQADFSRHHIVTETSVVVKDSNLCEPHIISVVNKTKRFVRFIW